jgi:hypothetical protein
MKEVLNKIGEQITKEAKESLKRNLNKRSSSGNSYSSNSIASGRTYESIKFVATENSLTFFADESLIYVSNGRRAGTMPPLDKIKEWVLDKRFLGTVSKSKLNNISFAIAKNISKHGTNPEYPKTLEIIESSFELIEKAIEQNIDILLNIEFD